MSRQFKTSSNAWLQKFWQSLIFAGYSLGHQFPDISYAWEAGVIFRKVWVWRLGPLMEKIMLVIIRGFWLCQEKKERKRRNDT